MSIIGKTIRTYKLKGVVLYEYLGFEKAYKSPSQTCLVILDDNHEEHHVFASDVTSFDEENYQEVEEKRIRDFKEKVLREIS